MIYDNIANQISLFQENKDKPSYSDALAIYHKKEDTNERKADETRNSWQTKNKDIKISFKEKLGDFYKEVLESPKIKICKLPLYSFVIQFRFTLAQPYISRDETDFYIIDNPVRKDKVFGLPYVAPTSWKGSLLAAARRLENLSEPSTLARLFGTDKQDQTDRQPEDFQAGRLYFFPTFFTQKSLEIINPHDRERRVGKNPILIESVPKGATGVFTLLYIPVPLNPDKNKEPLPDQFKADLIVVTQAIHAMLCEYGFGAKTSSGFGLAKGEVEIKTDYIEVNKPDQVSASLTLPEPQPPTEPESVKQIRAIDPDEDFSLKPKEWRTKRGATNSQADTYKNAREEIRNYETAMQKYQMDLTKYETQKDTPPPVTTLRWFASLTGLIEIAKQITDKDFTND